jgi:hypothetical protein
MKTLLTDLLGYFRRNASKMNEFQIKKSLSEINQIQNELQKQLKMKGVI